MHAGKIYYFLRVQRCNSLSHQSLHCDVGVQMCLNMIWSTQSADSGQSIYLFYFFDDLTNY